MNKEELITNIANKIEATKTDTNKFLSAFTEVITETLQKKDDVRLVGFGTFKTAKRKATIGRNPRTGDEIKIPASTKAKFVPGKQLADAVNTN